MWLGPLGGVLSAGLLTAIGLSSGEPIFLPFALLLVVVLIAVPIHRRLRRTAGWAKHFAIAAGTVEAKRGGEVSARLELDTPEEITGLLRVGLVCTCRHDRFETSTGEGSDRTRVTKEVTVYEQWQDASSSDRIQSYTFEIPFDGPFSHEGTCLSFAWSLRAEENRSRRRDPFVSEPIWVLP